MPWRVDCFERRPLYMEDILLFYRKLPLIWIMLVDAHFRAQFLQILYSIDMVMMPMGYQC